VWTVDEIYDVFSGSLCVDKLENSI
jgi:hypothetical protein